MIITDILLIIAGLLLVIFGAEWLVDGASGIARRAGVSEFVIGLTVVGFGTSCPELVVSLTGALQGNADVAIGNVVGSNIFNTLLILGLTALLVPVSVSSSNKKRDIPITIAVTLLFLAFALHKTLFGIGDSDGLSLLSGIVFLSVFAIYLYICFKYDEGIGEEGAEIKEISTVKAVTLVIAGLVGLIVGGRLFVDYSVSLARAVGVSDKLIAVTLLAGGTSMPELVTCIVAAFKKREQLALGNILGSNVFNILLIIGSASVITPLSTSSVKLVDAVALLAGVALLWIFCHSGKKDRIDRMEGLIMLLLEGAYLTYLFLFD